MGTSRFQESASRTSSSGRAEDTHRAYANFLQPEERYNDIMQTSAQRVLSKLKTRQMALSSAVKDSKSQKARMDSCQPPLYSRPPQPMPRKLEPLVPVRGTPESPTSDHRLPFQTLM